MEKIPRLIEIEEWECKCHDLPEELRGDPDDEHLACPDCGMHFHGDAEGLDVGDECPACKANADVEEEPEPEDSGAFGGETSSPGDGEGWEGPL